MEMISVSSNSDCEDMDVDLRSPPNIDDEVYTADWNEDYACPSINYKSDTVTSEGESHSKPKGEIGNFVIPLKQDKKNLIKDVIDDDEETVNYNYQSTDYNYSDGFKTSPVSQASKINENNIIKVSEKTEMKETQNLSEGKVNVKILKEQKKLEREKLREEKKAEQLRQKAFKVILTENQKNLKPEANIKFLKVHIDNKIINCAYGGNIITVLQQNDIQYAVEPQLQSFTITWSKRKTGKFLDDLGHIAEKVDSKDEDQLVYVLDWQKAVELIHNNELLSHVETVKSDYLDKKLTLIIYGLEKYFNYKRSKRNRNMKTEINDKRKLKSKEDERVFEEASCITRDQLEYALNDLQLLGKHNCRLLETPEELSFLVLNFTKSLSQAEYKQEKQKKQENYSLGCFVQNESASFVKIDKNGNGLLRLWQQQLSQFNSVGLETAQAIVSNVDSPLALVTQYENLSRSEGELLLQNIQIRRAAGILSSTRRVGPQLSKKIYNFFTSDDPELEL